MKKILFILAFGVFVTNQATSQNHVTLSYSIAFPLGDLGDYISPVSFRGFTVDYHNMVSDNIGLGFSTGWNIFYEELDEATYTLENQSLSGKQYRYSNQVPVLFSASFYLAPENDLNPFGSLGIGTMYTRRNTDMGIFSYEQDAWHFAFSPEIGLKYKVGYDHALSVSVQYYHGVQAGELDADQSYLALKFGYEL